eukprot:tig00000123_g6940.t1
MSWLDALLTKTFGPKGQPRLQFGEINAAIGATVETKTERTSCAATEARGPRADGRAERFWHWLKVAVVIAAAVVAVSVKKAKRTLALEVPVAEDTEKVAFNKRKTYKAIREGQLLPTDSVPGLPGTTAGELLVRNLRLQYVSRLRRSKAKKARLDSGDSSSSS